MRSPAAGTTTQPHSRAFGWRWLAQEHLAPLAAALVAGLLLIQPLAASFGTAMVGVGDVTWGVVSLWHWREAFLGNDSWFYTNRLYYPYGVSYLTNALGPLSGLIALPFWPLGPVVTYNATLLIGFSLSGYCMYLLARELGASRPVAWFAGLFYMLAPLHTAAVLGHMNKVFIGTIPLVLLFCHRGLRPEKPVYWAWLVGPGLLLAFLQAPEQMVFGALGCGVLVAGAALGDWHTPGRPVLRRAGWVTASIVACVSIVAWLTVSQVQATGTAADATRDALTHQPDLLQFLVPYKVGIEPFHTWFTQWLNPYVINWLEAAVYLSWIGLFLLAVAFLCVRSKARIWVAMFAICVVLALGPLLRVGGRDTFTAFELPIILPYAFATELPLIGYMRTPGRFMLLGYAALAAGAALGLDQLRRRVPANFQMPLVGAFALLLAIELWPAPYPTQTLPPVADFYRQIAADPEMYGILDLPIRPDQENHFLGWYVFFSTNYQLEQMTHGKGIASGHVSRIAKYHPVFAHFISENAQYDSPLQQDLRVDGEPSSRYANLRYYLAQNNYRYVVLHKPQPDDPVYKPGAWGEKTARALIDEVFGDQPPLVDDELVTVYEVGAAPPPAELTTSIALLEPNAGQSWTEHRWGESPQGLLVHAPEPMLAQLGVTVESILTPDGNGYFEYAQLTVESGDGAVQVQVPIAPFETAMVPVALTPGSQVITLTISSLADGNAGGQSLDFKIKEIDLRTALLPELLVAESPQSPQAAYGPGWYDPEQSGDGTSTWRWAASPAALWVYSREGGNVQLAATPTALHVPGTPDGKGNTGELVVSVGNAAPVPVSVTVGQPIAVPVTLQPGWNRVELALTAGNFRPVDYQPETGDGRPLSFALQGLTIHE